jgi:hypothetical protein
MAPLQREFNDLARYAAAIKVQELAASQAFIGQTPGARSGARRLFQRFPWPI